MIMGNENAEQNNCRRMAVFVVLTLFSLGVIIFVASNFRMEEVKFIHDELTDFNKGWQQDLGTEGTKGIDSFPCKLDSEKIDGEKSVEIYNQLPDSLEDESVLFLQTNHQRIQIFCEDQLLYEYGYHRDTMFGKLYGTVLHQIPLPDNGGGKTIRIHLSTPYRQVGMNISSMSIGNKSTVLLYILAVNAGRLLFSIANIIIGLGFLAAACILWKKRLAVNYRAFFWIGVFAVLSGFWVFFDTNLIQFFTSNLAMGYLISFLSFMLMPAAFLLYFKEVCNHKWKSLGILFYTYAAYFVTAVLLYLFKIAELATSVAVCHLFIVIIIVFSTLIGTREIRHYENEAMKTVLHGIIIWEISAVISILTFYDQAFDYTFTFRIGFFVFIIFLGKSVVSGTAHLIHEGMKADIYRSLAYTDILTDIPNRFAYEEKMQMLEGEFKNYDCVTLIVFDLDDLKKINDHYGHAQGDVYIKEFARALKECFTEEAVPYRIGGDEFGVLLLRKEEPEACIQRLNDKMEQYNKDAVHKITYSWGAAVRCTKEADKFDSTKLFREADASLYEMKKEKHKKY